MTSRFLSVVRTERADLRSLVIAALLLGLLPLVLSRFTLSVATAALIFALAGIGWNVLGGFAGPFSFGHAAYFGIGAYTVAVLLTRFSVTPWVGLVVGGLLAAAFGVGTGFVIFRYGLRGPYFALSTFALAEMLRLIANNMDLLNRGIGIHIPLVGGDSWARIQFEDTPEFAYYVILAFVLLATLGTMILVRTKAGHYMFAIREDEEAAAAVGVPPIRYLLAAMAISGFITAIAGGYYPQFLLFVDPGLAFGAFISVQILLRPVVGGVGTVWGPLVGGVVLAVLGETTRSLVRDPPPFLGVIEGVNGLDVMVFGAILIGVIILAPDGVVGVARRLRAKLS